MLEKQKNVYQELANNVLNEEFYKSSDLHLEKKKFSSFTNEMKNKEILSLRNKIKDKNDKNNRNETEDSLVQRARQRMMRKSHNQAKANMNRKMNLNQPQAKNSTKLTSSLNKGNLGSNKQKENSPSPNASMENPILDPLIPVVTHNIQPNKDCKNLF